MTARRIRAHALAVMVAGAVVAGPAALPATASPSDAAPSTASANALTGFYTATGAISLSVDGIGTNDSGGGDVDVEKPSAAATVRQAFLVSATTGFTGAPIVDGDVRLDGVTVDYDEASAVSNSISSTNAFADVTAIVKPVVDAAAVGRTAFHVDETSTNNYDGSILAVVFDDPGQPQSSTTLFFGAQNVAGDSFNVLLAEPIDEDDAQQSIRFGLGISYGCQAVVGCAGTQFSTVDIDGQRLTSAAGGEDDGANTNGALLTVGGLDDDPANPADPLASPDCGLAPRCDDELYDLKPVLADGATSFEVFTQNPSNDDNIFFAHLTTIGTAAVVGEGIVLAPADATVGLSASHTVTATVQDDDGNPVASRSVAFEVLSGPHVGTTVTVATDASGQASMTLHGTTAGTDVVVARFVDSDGITQTSNQAQVTWTEGTVVNLPPTVDAGPDGTGTTAAPAALSGTATDPEGDALTTSWSAGSAPCTFADAAAPSTTVTCSAAGTYTLTLSATDGTNAAVTDSLVLTVTSPRVPTRLESRTFLDATVRLGLLSIRIRTASVGAALFNGATNAPLAGKRLTFSTAFGPLCTATTNAAGRADCPGLLWPVALLALGYTVHYDGDVTYAPSTTSVPLLGS